MEEKSVILKKDSYKVFRQFIDNIASLVVFGVYILWILTNSNKFLIKSTFNYNIIHLKPQALTCIFTFSLIIAFFVTKLLHFCLNIYLDKNVDKFLIVKKLHDDKEYATAISFLKLGIETMALIIVTIVFTIHLNFFGLVLSVWLLFIVSILSMEATILQNDLKKNIKLNVNEDNIESLEKDK